MESLVGTCPCRVVLRLVVLFVAVLPTSVSGQFIPDQSILPPELPANLAAREGAAIAAGSEWIAVGIPAANLYGLNYIGAVAIYDRTDFSHVMTINCPSVGARTGVLFGDTIAMQGSRLVVGAPRDDTYGSGRGTVFVYDLSSPDPDQPVLSFSGGSPGRVGFGRALGLDGGTLAVGNGSEMFVYDLDSATPTVPDYSLNSPYFLSYIGWSVAVSGDRIAAGGEGWWVAVYDLTSPDPEEAVQIVSNPNPNGGSNNDRFGDAISLSGDILVVGAQRDNSSQGNDAGRAYVYDLSINTFPRHTLICPLGQGDHYFGSSVSIEGDTFVVGAKEALGGSGAAFVYDLNATNVSLPVHELNPTRSADIGELGASILLDGELVLVGAPAETLNFTTGGVVRVHDLDSADPDYPEAELSTGSPGEIRWGEAMDCSGNTIAIGLPAANKVFLYEEGAPDPVALSPEGLRYGDGLGESVAISGNRVAAGAPYFMPSGSTRRSGAVCVFDTDNNDPSADAQYIYNPLAQGFDQRFGWSVAVSGSILVVGSPDYRFNNLYSVGIVYVYDLNSASPGTPFLVIPTPDLTSYVEFGWDVDISGRRIVVGTSAGNGVSARAYVYDLDAPVPYAPVQTLENPSVGNIWSFGSNVSISGDSVVVGCDQIDTSEQDSSVFVYDLGTTAPDQPVFELLNPFPDSGLDKFGSSVSVSENLVIVGDSTVDPAASWAHLYDLSSASPETALQSFDMSGSTSIEPSFGWTAVVEGSTLAIGAPGDDSLATESGLVEIYRTSRRQISPKSIELNRGRSNAIEVGDIIRSDDARMLVYRNSIDITSVVEFEVAGKCGTTQPSFLEFVLESSVFSRRKISQQIELYDYDSDSWEIVDTRNASRFGDGVVTVSPSGDLSRFVEPGTGCVEARIRYSSPVNRTQFSANIDQIRWTVE